MLSCVAPSAGRKDVRDRVGTASRQRDPVVGFEGTRLAAIGAATLEKPHECEPLHGREGAVGGKLASPIVLPFGEHDFRVLAVIQGRMRQALITVAGVVATILRTVLIGVSDPPATHGFARFFGIALQPFAGVSALILWILEWHALYLADRRRRVNRTRQTKARA